MRGELDFSRPLECDVAVAGAGLAGLVAGAILARRGRRVAIVDRAPIAGGRGGATPHRGYWLDGGHRDGADPGDLQVGWRYGQLAEREADVRVSLREVEPAVRVHLLPADPAAGGASSAEGRWGAEGFLALARDALGCPEPLLPELAKLLARLAGAGEEARRAAIPVRLDDWLEAEVPQPELRRAVLTLVTVVYCERPERASLGRLMGFLARRGDLPPVRPGFADDPEVGGMQGLMRPFAGAVEERGGRILPGFAPACVSFEGARASGLVALDESQLALELRAPRVVLALPVFQALPLLPPERVDPGLAELARALEDEQADAIAWQAGLRRLPCLRATGEPEAHAGWNRVLVGPERRYFGGWHVPSLGSRRAAPPGRHLLHAFIARWLGREERIGWRESRAALDRLRGHLERFYADLDECIEWSAPQYIARPACLAWYWSPLVRHGVHAPGCEGLYLAGTTLESDAGPVDIAAHAGLEAARAVLAGDG